METINQLSKEPPMFQCDNLHIELLGRDEHKIRYRTSRNDGVDPTPADMEASGIIVDFLLAPRYGPIQ